MAEADASKHKEAYIGRKSESTRNPHTARATRRVKDLSVLCPEERILEQWRKANGESISDEAKVQFQIQAFGNTHRLADVRLWTEHHDMKSSKKVTDTGVIFLEFFFDGCKSEYIDKDGNNCEDVFIKAFEQMIENQLQERRIMEFREKFAARRRGGAVGSRSRNSEEDSCEGGGGEAVVDDDGSWRDFLKKPLPATNLSVRSLREAGCCLAFLVAQTSLSVSASEVLGQIAFQEHFPIDGKAQELPKCTKPLPRWTYGLYGCTAVLGSLTLLAWWQVMKAAIYPAPAP